MFSGFPLFPPQASTFAARVDALYFFLIAISAFFSTLIATLLVVFAVRYRRRRAGELPRPIHGSIALELVWTIIPLVISLGTFVWSADVFVATAGFAVPVARGGVSDVRIGMVPAVRFGTVLAARFATQTAVSLIQRYCPSARCNRNWPLRVAPGHCPHRVRTNKRDRQVVRP